MWYSLVVYITWSGCLVKWNTAVRCLCDCVFCEALHTSPPGCVWKALTLIWSPFSVHYAGPLGRPQQIRTISTPVTSSLKLKWHSLHPTCHTYTCSYWPETTHTNTDSWTCEDACTTHSWTCANPHTCLTYTFPQMNNPSKDTLVQNGRPSENTLADTQAYSCSENGECCTQTILVSLAQWDGVLTATAFTPVWTTLPTHMCVQMTMCVSPFYAAGVAFDTMANIRSWEWPVIQLI